MYKVLARKYRPKILNDLIGQKLTTTALENGIKLGKLPHAFLFTGIQGVGKTSTARILARSLNCLGIDGKGKETIKPCGICPACKSISKDRNIDVIEIDAASRTSVEDVREIIEASRYKPVSARYKIYIVDEIHMLSKNAFNALLKTLEEPPSHVKFIFATTEIHKIPTTILSRCMKFNLRRLHINEIIKLISNILTQENINFEKGILHHIAVAAEGSARDALSILESAIILDGKTIKEKTIENMLGLITGKEIEELFLMLQSGITSKFLILYNKLYERGTTPKSIFQMLLTHISKLIKEESLEKKNKFPTSMLHRLWMAILKGIKDLENSPCDFQAGEVILLRLNHLSKLPELESLIHQRHFETNKMNLRSQECQNIIPLQKQENINDKIPETFSDLIISIQKNNKDLAINQLKYNVQIIKYNPGKIIATLKNTSQKKIWEKLKIIIQKTFPTIKWVFEIVEQHTQNRPLLKNNKILEQPLIKKALQIFPGAKIQKINNILNKEN